MSLLPALLAIAMIGDPPLKGDHMAPFTMAEPGGGLVTWRPGRVTVLCAFAYWCDTWKTQQVRISEARKKLTGVPVDFYAISVDGQWLEVDKKADWSRRLIDTGSRWSKALSIDRVPYTLVIDQTGTVRWTGYGISRSDDIVRGVRESFQSESTQDKTIYLTFDDFPAKSLNSELLDTLRQLDVHASLFVIGENALANPKWVHRAAQDGNRLEVHGWSHEATGSNPERCRNWLDQVVHRKPEWLRGPGSSVIQDFGGHPFKAAEIDPYDFLRPGVPELKRRVFGRMKPGAILHLHAGVQDTISALPDIIARGKKLGYRFSPLP